MDHFKQLNLESCFSPGSQLWVSERLEDSVWSQKIDWYLNYQLTRSRQLHARELPKVVQNIMSTEDVYTLEASSNDILMVAAQHFLPVRQIILVPKQKDFKAWLETVQGVWQKLLKPSTRIFCAPGADLKLFDKLWRKDTEPGLISIVEG